MKRLLLSLLLLATPAFADRNDFHVEYYPIHGDTVQDLRRELNTRGPVGDSGKRSEGNTRWRIAWRYQYLVREGICTAVQLEVDLDIRMILPKWEDPDYLDYVLVGHWDRYKAVLRKHEDGHRYRAEATAREVRHMLMTEPGEKDCKALGRRLDGKATALLQALSRAQDQYDDDTDNGKKQGLWLPESLPPRDQR